MSCTRLVFDKRTYWTQPSWRNGTRKWTFVRSVSVGVGCMPNAVHLVESVAQNEYSPRCRREGYRDRNECFTVTESFSNERSSFGKHNRVFSDHSCEKLKGEVRRKMNFIYVLGFVVLSDVVNVFPVSSSSFARKTTGRNQARSHSGAWRGRKTKWDLKLFLSSLTYLIRYFVI